MDAVKVAYDYLNAIPVIEYRRERETYPKTLDEFHDLLKKVYEYMHIEINDKIELDITKAIQEFEKDIDQKYTFYKNFLSFILKNRDGLASYKAFLQSDACKDGLERINLVEVESSNGCDVFTDLKEAYARMVYRKVFKQVIYKDTSGKLFKLETGNNNRLLVVGSDLRGIAIATLCVHLHCKYRDVYVSDKLIPVSLSKQYNEIVYEDNIADFLTKNKITTVSNCIQEFIDMVNMFSSMDIEHKEFRRSYNLYKVFVQFTTETDFDRHFHQIIKDGSFCKDNGFRHFMNSMFYTFKFNENQFVFNSVHKKAINSMGDQIAYRYTLTMRNATINENTCQCEIESLYIPLVVYHIFIKNPGIDTVIVNDKEKDTAITIYRKE